MDNYTIEHKDSDGEGSFYIEEDDFKIAELNYVKRGKDINITHTSVDDFLQGKGVGKKLVMAAANWAREKGIKVIPTCSYARAIFNRDETLEDVKA